MPRGRDFRLLLIARTVSMFGTTMATIAVPFAVLEISGSATDVGLVIAAAWVPQLLLLLFGGVVADRMPRQRVMVYADAVAAIAQLSTAALLFSGELNVPALAALQAVNGAALAFFFPASQALVPETVKPRELRAANAALRTSINAASIGGAAAGGLLAAVSVTGALAVDAASFALSAALCAGIGALGIVREYGPSMLEELREGWRAFATTRWLWVVVVQFGIVNAAFNGVMFVLGPVIADRELGGAAAWGLVLACWSAGLLIGALISFRVRPRHPLLVGELAVIGCALPVAALIGPTPLLLIASAALLAGLGSEIFGVQWNIAMQQHIPAHTLARLSAYDALGSFTLIPVGVALAGPLSAAVGMDAALVGAATVLTLAPLAALAVRDVRDLLSTDVPSGLTATRSTA